MKHVFMGLMRLFKQVMKHRGADFKSRWRQTAEVISLFLRGHLMPSEYYSYGLVERDITKDEIRTYLPAHFNRDTINPRLNQDEWRPLVSNKLIFHEHYRQVGLPLPWLVGRFHPIDGMANDGSPLRDAEDVKAACERDGVHRIVVKPVSGRQGQGVRILEVRSDELQSLDGSHDLIVEGFLKTHDDLREINPFTTTTVRVVTLRMPDGQVTPAFAAVRMGRRNAVVDTWYRGGVGVGVDLEGGVMLDGRMRHGAEWLTCHPDSGERFAGNPIPMWDQVMDVCVKAARSSPGLNSIGWDVIVTPTGPRIIEGNDRWDLLQEFTRGILSQPVVRVLDAWGFPHANELPPISVGSWLGFSRPDHPPAARHLERK